MIQSKNGAVRTVVFTIRILVILAFGLCCGAVFSPARGGCDTLSGSVTDAASGLPLESVSVALKGRRAVSLTGTDGCFSFSGVPAGSDTLICALIDYERLTIPVSIPGDISLKLIPQPVELETVVVEGVRPDEVPPHERTSSSVTVIDAEEITDRAATVDQVLDSQVGIDVRSLGGTGASSEVSIRGSTTQQVAVYVDGVPMTAGGSGINALSFVPMNQVKRIEVYRGSSPGSFGSGAIGGIVDISTIAASTGFGLTASTSYGAFSTMHQSVASRFGSGRNRFALSMGRNESENDFRFHDDRGTTIDTSDDGWETRENSDFTSWSMLAKWDNDLTGGHLVSSKISYTDSERGVSGLGRRPARHARLSQSALMLQSQYRYRKEIAVLGWTSLRNRAFYDPQDEAGRRGRQDSDDDITVWGIRSEWKPVAGPAIMNITAEYSREEFKGSDGYDATIVPPSDRQVAGVGFNPEIMLLDGKLWVVPLVNVKHIADRLQQSGIMFSGTGTDSTTNVDRTVFTSSLGVRYHVTSRLTARMNAGRYTREPEFDELFGDTGDVVGNTELDVETSRNADAGIHYVSGSGNFDMDVTLFYRYAKDLIQRRNFGDYIISENIGKAEIAGIETWVGGSFRDNSIRYHVSAAYQDARNRSDETVFRKERYYGKELPYHPEIKSAAAISYRLHSRITSRWKTEYESECYKGPSNLDEEKLEERFIHSLEFDCSITDNVQGIIEIVNITDDHAPDRWGYPKPGRGVYATLKWNYNR